MGRKWNRFAEILMRSFLTLFIFVLLVSSGCARFDKPNAVSDTQSSGSTQLQAPEYTVMCDEGADSAIACSVDSDTYAGWSQYINNCAGCHGPSAFGTERAPDLTQSLDTNIDYFDIHFVIMHGRHSAEGDMPSWKSEAEVANQIDQIYLYLKARADAVLPPGVPTRTRP